MLVKILKTCLLLSITISLNAQKAFVDAVIYKNDGETINGQINYQEWFINPEFIMFRATGSATVQNLYPRDISKFLIKKKNEIYETAVLDVNDENALDIEAKDAFITDRDAIHSIKIRRDTAFVLLLEQGKVSLYSYVDSKLIEHLFIKKGKEKHTELLNLRFKIANLKGDFHYIEVKDYQTRLSYILADCPKAIENIKGLYFTTEHLKEIVRNYNKCVGAYQYSSIPMGAKVKFYVYSGLTLPMALVNGLYFSKTHLLKGNITIPIGAGVETSIDRALSPIRLGAELSFKTSTYKAELSGNNRIISYDAKSTGVHLTPYIKTVFYDKKRYGHSTFFKLGLTGSYYFDIRCQRDFVLPANLFPSESFKMSKTSLSVMLNAGYQINKFYLEGHFEPYSLNLVSKGENIFRTVCASLLVGYVF